MSHPSMQQRRTKCEYAGCTAPATHLTIGGAFGTVLHCHFHSIRCIAEGYARYQKPMGRTSL